MRRGEAEGRPDTDNEGTDSEEEGGREGRPEGSEGNPQREPKRGTKYMGLSVKVQESLRASRSTRWSFL